MLTLDCVEAGQTGRDLCESRLETRRSTSRSSAAASSAAASPAMRRCAACGSRSSSGAISAAARRPPRRASSTAGCDIWRCSTSGWCGSTCASGKRCCASRRISCKPLEFLIPFFDGGRRLAAEAAAGSGALRRAELRQEPAVAAHGCRRRGRARPIAALNRPDVRGAAAYHDARVDSPERLALENVLDAERHGATGVQLLRSAAAAASRRRASGVRVRDALDGDGSRRRARVSSSMRPAPGWNRSRQR